MTPRIREETKNLAAKNLLLKMIISMASSREMIFLRVPTLSQGGPWGCPLQTMNLKNQMGMLLKIHHLLITKNNFQGQGESIVQLIMMSRIRVEGTP
jgi:hypothetical protein